MSTQEPLSRPVWRPSLMVAFAVYAPLAAVVIVLCRHQLNVDGVSYIRITEYYVSRQYDLAVNGYWSPLLSWLLVPWHFLKADLLLGAKVTNALAGLLFILGVQRLADRFELRRDVSWAIPLAAGLLALSWLPRAISPDIVLAALLTLYFDRSFEMSRSGRLRDAVMAGLYAGLAYLAKAYALPFFVLHHFLAAFVVAKRPPGCRLGWREVRCWVAGSLACLAVAGPWMAVLSAKYGRPTFSTTSRFVHALAGPQGDFEDIHRLAVPAKGRITTWEDPTGQPLPWPDWNPVGSVSEMAHQFRLFHRNGGEIARAFFDADGLGLMYVTLLAIPLLACVPRGSVTVVDPWMWRWSLAAVGSYLLGFLFVFGGSYRYYIPLQGLLIVLVGAAAGLAVSRLLGDQVESSGSRSPAIWRVTLAAVILGSCALPLVETARDVARRPGLTLRRLADELRAAGVTGTLASNHWHSAVMMAYYLDVPCAGTPRPASAPAVVDEMKRAGVRCFLQFEGGVEPRSSLATLDLHALLPASHVIERGDVRVSVYGLD